LACVKDQSKVPASKVVLNNMYRLLEAFRSNAFFGFEPEEPNTEPPETHRSSMVFEGHSPDVRVAIEGALKDVFSEMKSDAAIRIVENVLRGIVAPERFDPPQVEQRDRAARFFSGLSKRLSYA